MAQITLFVAWLGDFEIDVKAAGLKITEISHEYGEYYVTIRGTRDKITNFLNDSYCVGMSHEEIAIFLEYYCYGDKEDAAFFLEESYEDLN